MDIEEIKMTANQCLLGYDVVIDESFFVGVIELIERLDLVTHQRDRAWLAIGNREFIGNEIRGEFKLRLVDN